MPHGTLKFLVYTSSAVTRFYEEDLDTLLVEARARNTELGITGLLLYRNDQFIQFLEGPPRHVDALMKKIERDPRHTRVRVVLDEFALQRRFEDWSMGYRTLREAVTPAPEGFRDTIADLRSAPDRVATGRAAKELALWFRVRSGGGLVTA
ncbi:hypothetical protein B4915_09135 [Leucobacter massiliensis]|uniref:BLUF domain-containing protein n=1 Tax=Leucobacter massiliensis TaxID=1686285 RepID=A0A2S9QP45_9MICO|nr:hypothetical protein B4915_09135 [Leucobacter massiliensis]